MSLGRVIKTPITLAAWFIICFVFTLICIPLTYKPEPQRYQNRTYFFLTTLWCKLLMFFSFIYVKKKGEENLPSYPQKPSIIVANHTSCIDIFLLESIMDRYPHIWLSKSTYAKIPLFSTLLDRMHIAVDRTSPHKAARALVKAYNRTRRLISHILMFPEGTRHDDGKVHEFNAGFAVLAKKLNRPVIPIAISGLHKIFPKRAFLFNYRAAEPTMTIGKPMTMRSGESPEAFTKRVHNWFTTTLEDAS